MDNYNSDGNDPLKLHGLINSLRRQLREERFKRHELQTSNDRMTHRLRSLEHSLKKQTRKKKEKVDDDDHRDDDDDGDNDDDDDTHSHYDGKPDEEQVPGQQDEDLIRRLQSRGRHLFSALKRAQAQRDDLQVQAEGQERIKEWMDSQLAHLETSNSELESALFNTSKERDDGLIQIAADSNMKDFLAKEWDKAKTLNDRLLVQIDVFENQKRDLLVQIDADSTMKEYLAGQLEVLEQKQKLKPWRPERARGRY